jgi:hypothetical protein
MRKRFDLGLSFRLLLLVFNFDERIQEFIRKRDADDASRFGVDFEDSHDGGQREGLTYVEGLRVVKSLLGRT